MDPSGAAGAVGVTEKTGRQKQTLLVAGEWAGERLDLFLVNALPGVSRKMVKTALDGGMVFIDQRVQRRANFRLQGGEKIWVTLACPWPESTCEDTPELYQDPWLLAINKPAGLPCHPHRPGSDSVLSRLTVRLEREGNRQPPVLLHRLDMETSGVLLFALSEEGNRSLSRQFAERQLEKVYLAVTAGHPPAEFKVHNRLGKGRRGRTCSTEQPYGQEAITDFKVLNRGMGWSLVEARPHTGRTHQIRVHLAEAGFPLLGDRLYGGPTSLGVDGRMISPGRCLLHAERVSFRHPADSREMTLKAPAPEEFGLFIGGPVG
jgi:23S rRNA pseudouridine1911/1915/1917 synthase